MRITLVYPSVGRKKGKKYLKSWQMEPLAIAILARLTPGDIELRFYDDRLEDINFAKLLMAYGKSQGKR